MKKEELRYDPIRENIAKGIYYLNENRVFFFKILAIILVLIGCVSYYNYLGNIKSENASHIAGRAQNTFINGNLDEALVKFERVINDYPNTTGSIQSLVYLLSNAINANNDFRINELLSEHSLNINDLVIQSAIYKIRADAAFKNGDTSDAIKYYKNARSTADVNAIMYDIDVAILHIKQEAYIKAMLILESIINQENLAYNVKNITEELLAFTKQKMDR